LILLNAVLDHIANFHQNWIWATARQALTPNSVFTSFANSGIFGKLFDKSAFSRIANDGIFGKLSDKVLCGILNLFAILS